MFLRLRSFLLGLLAFMTAALLALAPVQAKTALGGYQEILASTPSEDQAIHLTLLGDFGYHDRIAPECCNAPRGAGRNLDGFSDAEVGIISEADRILSSSQMNTIRQAYENGESVTVVVNGRTIQYEPDLPASGMTMFGEDGFLIGREAFANPGELDRTVLHELHRLTTSQSASGVSGSLATNETQAAFDFANRAFEAMNP